MNYKIDEKKTYNIIISLLELIKDGNDFASVERKATFDNENIVFQMKKNDPHTILQVLNCGVVVKLRVDGFSVKQITDIVYKSINI